MTSALKTKQVLISQRRKLLRNKALMKHLRGCRDKNLAGIPSVQVFHVGLVVQEYLQLPAQRGYDITEHWEKSILDGNVGRVGQRPECLPLF